jgi:hypothetical protein
MIEMPFEVDIGKPNIDMGGAAGSAPGGMPAMGQPTGIPGMPSPTTPMQSGGLQAPIQTFQEGGEVVGMQDPRVKLIADAEQAILGKHPQPEQALQAFVKAFGEPALKYLRDQVIARLEGAGPRMVKGPGGPKTDDIPARINGVEEARLSDGEFVVPADAVTGAGGGDPAAGAQQLTQLSQMLAGGQPDPAGAVSVDNVMT